MLGLVALIALVATSSCAWKAHKVALVPVEDKDGDNLWVDAPNAQGFGNFASSPVTDIMYAESNSRR